MRKKILGIISLIGIIVVFAVCGMLFLNRKDTSSEVKIDVDWYDEKETEFVITTAEQLYEVAALSKYYDFAGQTIKLGSDIIVNDGNAAEWNEKTTSVRKWYPIKNFAGTFDGQGYTISGIYGKAADISMAMFTKTQPSCVIKNFRLVNSYFQNYCRSGLASIAAGGSGTFTQIYSDAIIKSEYGFCGGILSSVNAESLIEECQFSGTIYTFLDTCGGIVDAILGGKVTVQHCLFDGEIKSDHTYNAVRVGGIVGLARNEGTSLFMKDCLSVGKITVARDLHAGSIIGWVRGEATYAVDQTFGTYESFRSSYGSIESGSGNPLRIEEKKILGYGAYQRLNLDFDNYWAVVENATPTLRCFAETIPDLASVKKLYNTDWYNAEEREQTIRTAEDFWGLWLLSATTDFSSNHIKLEADINLNDGKASDWGKTTPENRWYVIKRFGGVLDGQGHTLSGVYVYSDDSSVGIFEEIILNGVVKNLKVTNSYFCNTMEGTSISTGTIAGTSKGTIDTVYSDAIIDASNQGVGGIAGVANSTLATAFINCWFDGSIIMRETSRHGGGILGYTNKGSVAIRHCLYSGTIDTYMNSNPCVGGFIGTVISGEKVTVSDCLSSGVINAHEAINNIGTYFGNVYKERTINVDNSYSTEECYTKVAGVIQGESVVELLPFRYPENEIKGYKGYQNTTLDFSKYWAVDINGTPILKSFAKSTPSVAGKKRNVDLSWYKADAKTYTIKTAAQFYGFMIAAAGTDFEGKTVRLGANITLNSGNAADWKTKAPSQNWYPIKDFAGTFDGKGYTIRGLYCNHSIVGTNSAIFSTTTKDSVVKNFRVVNSYFNTDNETADVSCSSVIGTMQGVISGVYSEAIVEASNKGCAGIVGVANGDSEKKISNCWFNGTLIMTEESRYGGGIIGYTNKSTLIIEHCLSTGTIETYMTSNPSVGGILGSIQGGDGVTIKDCLSLVKFEINAAKNNIASYVGNIGKERKLTIKDCYASLESHEKTIGVTQAGSTVNGSVFQMKESTLNGYGGYQMTTLDFGEYWAVVTNDTPILQMFATTIPSIVGVKHMIDTSWYKENEDTYTIKTVAQLYGLSVLSATNDFAGKKIKLGANITINTGDATEWNTKAPNFEWYPIKKFAGIFDGQGYTISGVYASGNSNMGLFADATKESVIRNLKIVNSYFHTDVTDASVSVGSITGSTQGKLEKIYSDAIIDVCNDGSGGIVGVMNGSSDKKISECWFNGTIHTGENSTYVGGIVGYTNQGTLLVEHCLFTGNMNTHTTFGPSSGGIVGYVINGSRGLTISDCLSAGLITAFGAANNMGSVLGRTGTEAEATIVKTYASTECYDLAVGLNQGSVNGNVVQIARPNLLGVAGYISTKLDFASYWYAVDKSLPMLQAFADSSVAIDVSKVVIPDTSWYKENETEFVINTAEQFYGFAELSRTTTFEGKTIKLGADIVINEGNPKTDAWSETNAPINKWATYIGPNIDYAFRGTFDGQGHTISGVYASGATYVGLFGYVHPIGVLKDFRLVDSYFYGTGDFVASIAARGNGYITGVYSNAIVEGNSGCIAGFVAQMNGDYGSNKSANERTISNSWFDGTVTMKNSASYNIGGFMAIQTNITSKMEHCLMSGTINNTVSNTHGGRVGGFHGCLNQGTTIIKDCLNAGTMNTIGTTKGSYIGYASGSATYNLSNLYATTESCLAGTTHVAVHGEANANVATLAHAELLGVNGYANTNLIFDISSTPEKFDGHWAARKENVPAPRCLVKAEDGLAVDASLRKVDISWYNETDTEFVITTKEQFYGFAELSKTDTFVGKTIKLGADIVLNEGNPKDDAWSATKAPTNKWSAYIGPSVGMAFQGTFDGQGHTIRGVYVSGTTYVGLFGYAHPNSRIMNFRLLDSYFYGTGDCVGSIAGRGNGTIANVYTNAIVESNGGNLSGFVAQMNGDYGTGNGLYDRTISNCWFDGTVTLKNSASYHVGGFLGTKTNVVATFEHCLFTGTLVNNVSTTAGGRVGGFVGVMQGQTTFTDCLSAGKISNLGANSGSYIGYNNGGSYSFDKAYAVRENCMSGSTHLAVQGAANANVTDIPKNDLIGTGGYTNTNLIFDVSSPTETIDGYWVARKDVIPALKTFVPEAEWLDISKIERPVIIGAADTSWMVSEGGTKENPYLIKDAEDLLGLSQLSATNGFSGKYIKLTNDIKYNAGNAKDWASKEPKNIWSPIGKSTAFAGTFDGDGHTISGLYTSATSANIGLFGNVSGTVQNLRLENSYFKTTTTGNAYIGSIAGFLNGTMTNIYSNAIIQTAGYESGGMVGRFGGTATRTISNCWFDGSVIATASHIGGFVGSVNMGNKTISNCLNTGTVTCTWTGDAEPHTAGFVGSVWYTKPNAATVATTLNLEHCLNAGKIVATGTKTVGAVVGSYVNNGGGTTYGTITNVYYTKESYKVGISAESRGDITGSSVNIDEVHFNALNEEQLSGLYAVTNTKLDFINIWGAREGKVPAIKSLMGSEKPLELVGVATPDTSWYNDTDTEFVLTTKNHFYGFAELSKSTTFEGKTVKLGADIVINEGNPKTGAWSATKAPLNKWTAYIGPNIDYAFRGTFDGQGHTISGVYASGTTFVGLFGYVHPIGVLKDFRLVDSYFYGTGDFVASIAARGNGYITGVYSNAIVEGNSGCIAGFVAQMNGDYGSNKSANERTISNSWFDGTVTMKNSASYNIGGFMAIQTNITSKMEHCLMSGTINNTVSNTHGGRVGGFHGCLNQGTTIIKDCLNAGTMNTIGTTKGSYIGYASGSATYNLSNLYATTESCLAGTTHVAVHGEANANVISVAKDNLLGEKAKNSASSLNWSEYWETVEDKVPTLQIFNK